MPVKTKTFMVGFSSKEAAIHSEVCELFRAFKQAEQQRISTSLNIPIRITSSTALLSLLRGQAQMAKHKAVKPQPSSQLGVQTSAEELFARLQG